jgi:hypothetical protein
MEVEQRELYGIWRYNQNKGLVGQTVHVTKYTVSSRKAGNEVF